MQMEACWKLTQLKSSSIKVCLLRVPDGLDSEGLCMTLIHALKETREYLIKHNQWDFQDTDEPLPDCVIYFKKVKEGRVPPAVYMETALANIKGYSTKDGLRMLTFECGDKEWLKMVKLWEHMIRQTS